MNTSIKEGQSIRWGEYRVVCTDYPEGHLFDQPSVRGLALRKLEGLEAASCGPHKLQQREVIRINMPWGDLLETDPQTEAKDQVLAAAGEYTCPKCHAIPKQECCNLSTLRNKGERVPTVWPHQERLDLALPEGEKTE
jgi:hypothetical protein